MLYYIYITNNGVPQTELSPAWTSLQDGTATGTDRMSSAPDINEVGGEGNGNGWYCFDITYGQAPWSSTTVNLVGVIDADPNPSPSFPILGLSNIEKNIPVLITLRSLGLMRVAHKGEQVKETGDLTFYKTDGVTVEMRLDMHDSGTTITRTPIAPA